MSGWHSAPLSALAVIEDDGAATGAADHDELEEHADLMAHRQARRRARARRVTTGVAGLLTLLVLWQLAAVLLNDQVALPSVAQTAQQFVHYFDRPYPAQGKPIWFDLYISLRRILTGFVFGVAVGVAAGAAMSASQAVRHLVDPVIEVIGRCRRWPSSRCSSSGSASARCPRRS
jgi:hypothetical protein